MWQEYERWLHDEALEREYEQSVLDDESKEVPYDDSDDYPEDYYGYDDYI